MGILAVVLAATKREPGAFFLGGVVWAWLAIAAGALAGIAVALGEHPPGDPLHVIYGVLAVAALPGAAVIARDRPGAARAVVWAIGAIVVLILVFRLFQTGG